MTAFDLFDLAEANRERYRNLVKKVDMVMLTFGGKDVGEIPKDGCETVVYHAQEIADRQAVEAGAIHGMLVSTRPLR